MLFQQTGGLTQATGEESGLEMNPTFFWAHRQGARRRRRAQRARLPHPPLRGERGRHRPRARAVQEDHLRRARGAGRTSSSRSGSASRSSRRVKVDRTLPEAEGQHHRRVLGDDDRGRRQLPAPALPRERGRRGRHPARHGVAPLHDLGGARTTRASARTCAAPTRPSTASASSGAFGVAQKLARRERGATASCAALFQTFAHAAGLYGYHLPDMDEIAKIATSTTTTISAAAKATWRSASSS